MTTDRRIELGVSVPDFGLAPGGGQPQARQEPDAQARERFEQAMAKPAASETTAEVQIPSAPMALFGLRPAPSSPPSESALAGDLGQAVQRLMVGDGSSGQRQVRMELKDEVLPGVTVTVQEAEGRVQVDFTCRIEATRLRLNAAAPELARELAERLRRDTLVRVQTDDEEDPCLQEALGRP